MASKYVEQGQALLREGKYDLALGHFEAALDEGAEPLQALLGAARASALLGHVDTAVKVLQQARTIAPSDSSVLRELFKLQLLEGQYAQAIDAARTLAVLEPTRGEPLYEEGVALLLQSDADSAEARFQAALAKEPGLWQAGQALAKIERMRGKTDEARTRLAALVRAHPTEPALANDLASLYLAEGGQEAKAEAVLRPVIAAHPADATTAYNLAVALRPRDKVEAQRFAEIASKGQGALSANARRLMDALKVSAVMLSQIPGK